MGLFTELPHPLIKNKMTMLRSAQTGGKEFRELVEELAMLLCYEATRDVTLTNVTVETPICESVFEAVDEKFAVVPVLRAGIGMTGGVLRLIPNAKVGHIGIYRNPETLEPVEYYCKLPPDIGERRVFLVDPMLATGGTAAYAISFLKERGVPGGNIRFLCLVSCPEGVKKIMDKHPDVDIITAAHDKGLNEHGYIVPGLGDAGDRLFGTR